MSAPAGWQSTTLGELGRYLNGRAFKKHEWATSGRPIIRIQNLTGSSEHFNFFAGEAEDRYVVRPGDLLVSWAATLGAYSWQGPEGVLNQHIFKVESKIDPKFHKYLLDHKLAELMQHTHGSGMVHITRGRFDSLPVQVPNATEQRQIVELLDDHLSRLDAAAAGMALAGRRSRALVKSILIDLIPDEFAYPRHWRRSAVAGAGTVQLGRQRHPDWHIGPNMKPYLRVANVFEDRIDGSNLKEMHWDEGTFERFKLQPGDVLLNEGQSPEFLGRPAIYRGDPADVAFTNSLIRFKANPEVLPEFALLVFRRHMHAGRFTRESRITTNIAHLSASRLKSVEFPIPPLPEQRELVATASERLSAVSRLDSHRIVADKRAQSLRRALLEAAFSGRLTGEASAVDLMEELAGA